MRRELTIRRLDQRKGWSWLLGRWWMYDQQRGDELGNWSTLVPRGQTNLGVIRGTAGNAGNSIKGVPRHYSFMPRHI